MPCTCKVCQECDWARNHPNDDPAFREAKENENDLVFKIAERVKVLADMRMPELKIAANKYQSAYSNRATKDWAGTRGMLIEEILTGEFCKEEPRGFAE